MAKNKDEGKKKARKKALGLAAVATAAAVAPEAAQVVVQKTEAPQPVTQVPSVEVPEPKREEYSKPRPLKTIVDLLKGVFGVGTARATVTDGGADNRLEPINPPHLPHVGYSNLPSDGSPAESGMVGPREHLRRQPTGGTQLGSSANSSRYPGDTSGPSGPQVSTSDEVRSRQASNPTLPPASLSDEVRSRAGAPGATSSSHVSLSDEVRSQLAAAGAEAAEEAAQPPAEVSVGEAPVNVAEVQRELESSTANQERRAGEVQRALDQAASVGITLENNERLRNAYEQFRTAEEEVDQNQTNLQQQVDSATNQDQTQSGGGDATSSQSESGGYSNLPGGGSPAESSMPGRQTAPSESSDSDEDVPSPPG